MSTTRSNPDYVAMAREWHARNRISDLRQTADRKQWFWHDMPGILHRVEEDGRGNTYYFDSEEQAFRSLADELMLMGDVLQFAAALDSAYAAGRSAGLEEAAKVLDGHTPCNDDSGKPCSGCAAAKHATEQFARHIRLLAKGEA